MINQRHRFTSGENATGISVNRGNVGKNAPASTPGFHNIRGKKTPLWVPPTVAKKADPNASEKKFNAGRRKRAQRLSTGRSTLPATRSATLLGS